MDTIETYDWIRLQRSVIVGAWPQKSHFTESLTEGTSMRFISSQTLRHLPIAKLLAPANGGSAATIATLPPTELLQRASDPVEAPDRSYWTAYDHFMVEREARAMRRAYVYALLAKWLGAVRKRLFG